MCSFWVWNLDTNWLSVCMCKSTSMLCLRRTAADACIVCLCIDIYIMLFHTILLFISTCRYTCAYYSRSTDMQFGLHRGGVCQMHIFQFQVFFAKNDWKVSCSILYSTFVGSKPFQDCSKFPPRLLLYLWSWRRQHGDTFHWCPSCGIHVELLNHNMYEWLWYVWIMYQLEYAEGYG